MKMDEKKELVKKQEKLRKGIKMGNLCSVLLILCTLSSFLFCASAPLTMFLSAGIMLSNYMTQTLITQKVETKLQLKEIELMEIKKNHGTAMQKKEKTTQEKTTREKLIENSQAPYSFRFNGRPHQYPSKQGTTNQTYTKNR